MPRAVRALLLLGAGLWQSETNPDVSALPEASLAVAAEYLTCTSAEQIKWLQERSAIAARTGFRFHSDPELAMLSEVLWQNWSPHSNKFGYENTAGGTMSLAEVLVGNTESLFEGYCLLAHVTAGFITARSVHIYYAQMTGNPEAEVPREVLKTLDDLLIEALLLLGHNRLLDVGRLAGWSVGGAQILEARNAIQRACPESSSPEEEPPPCIVTKLEEEMVSGLLASLNAVPGPVVIPSCRVSWGAPLAPRPGSCQARAATGGTPCQVRVWYLGTHEALFREVEYMWDRYPDTFNFEYVRVNNQGIYNPADNLQSETAGGGASTDSSAGSDRPRPNRWSPTGSSGLNFRFVTEDILDIQPAAIKFRSMLIKERGATASNGTAFDMHILLCTIPAFVCSAFVGLSMPMVMYAANPATAQVPHTQFKAWLALFADFAADPKNQLLVSNTWSQAQFEYQTGVNIPMIRAHGLYTQAYHGMRGLYSDGPRSRDVMVYDRMSPMLSRVLEALRYRLSKQADSTAKFAASMRSFVHQADTDRSYQTFSSFRAVVFNPGDVEQMAFYEFYSMEIPLFVPSDPSRYMWQQLPGMETLDESCGKYAAWMGTWELRDKSPVAKMTLNIDCRGHVTIDGGYIAGLQELDRMDYKGFTHCVVGLEYGEHHVRLRIQRNDLQVIVIDNPDMSCSSPLPRDVSVVMLNGTRLEGDPPMLTVWDHDIFASSIWYLDARLPGLSRWKHSPFRLTSIEAVHEWSRMMDYFRFPAVGLFNSMAHLLENVASDEQLYIMIRGMKDFNECTLRQSTQEWATVLNAAVSG